MIISIVIIIFDGTNTHYHIGSTLD